MIAALALFFGAAATESADSIMAKVAANQDRAEAARTNFVYHQNVLVRVNHTNGKMAREEYWEFNVTPSVQGVQKVRTHFLGKYVRQGKVIEYHEPGEPQIRIDIDGEIATDLAGDLTMNKSKDGIARKLFPLTADKQKDYDFRMDGTEEYRGKRVLRIAFQPKPGGGTVWAGEALIDENDYQPVLVTTHLDARIPLVVKTLLGTNIEQVGFKVSYQRFDENLWFPVNFGGEFKVRGLFFYARRVGISMQNSNFQRADVSSKVTYSRKE